MNCTSIECVEKEARSFLSGLGFNSNFQIVFSPDLTAEYSYFDKNKNIIYINLFKYTNLYNEWSGEAGLVSTFLFILIISSFLIENGYSLNNLEDIILKKFGENSIEYLVFKYIFNK
ncbi:MAG: hypothetical protein QXV69_02040 [Sulfolobaceae archaeon]